MNLESTNVAKSRKARVTLSISKDVLRSIDSCRGDVSRSYYVETLLSDNGSQKNVVQEAIKSNGVVYTPSILAEYLATTLLNYFFQDRLSKHGISDISILDPACGNGQLLLGVMHSFQSLREQINCDRKNMFGNIAFKICGVDIDKKALSACGERLNSFCDLHGKCDTHIINNNALFPNGGPDVESGWRNIKNQARVDNGFDLIIANPPWGADVAHLKHLFQGGYYDFAVGRIESAELFLEMAIKNLAPDGYLGFIMPDSIFGPEKSLLREMLVRSTEIKLISRLGEKIFDGINRACSIIILKQGQPRRNAKVRCFRLTPESRQSLLSGECNLHEIESRASVFINQEDFSRNPGCVFNIDAAGVDSRPYMKMSSAGAFFSDHLTSTRGVELSKTGLVCECGQCGTCHPFPHNGILKCRECKKEMRVSESDSFSIIGEKQIVGHVPLLVGEGISRYNLRSHLFIDTTKKGINYKSNAIYSRPKIVVRKTGVGISASIDYEGCYTNQVVYILYHSECDKTLYPLEGLLGVINSRAMYYYLVACYGENEWRSHPYLTQNQILKLPLPSPQKKCVVLMEEIAALLQPVLVTKEPVPPEIDAAIERNVAKMFGLSKEDYAVIYKTIEAAQELLPVKSLKNIGFKDIWG